jgi:hypothetical protein
MDPVSAEKPTILTGPAGFLCYPVAQAADITAFKATVVPVGEDQAPLIEQTNEIVRRLNNQIGRNVLVEAEPLIPRVGRLPGIDGKSQGKVVPDMWWKCLGGGSPVGRLRGQAAKSKAGLAGDTCKLGQPSTLRIVI